MKAMKNIKMNRVLGSIRRRGTSAETGGPAEDTSPETSLDTPEANAARSVRLFCESGANSGDEVLHLPAIVEAAESSPAAAKESANSIKKFLSANNSSKPHVQYNAIMLMRILTDNPGPTFTRNLDKKFVETVKVLLKNSRDPSVQQILRETLFYFENSKSADTNLKELIEMWKKEQAKEVRSPDRSDRSQQYAAGPPVDPRLQQAHHEQNYFSRNHTNRRLPPPAELSSRIEEAKTSAKLLTQVVQSTPPSELLHNELVREFADRCQSASRSVQAYMIAENPGPDNDTMLTLIETNEQLALAMTKHQRAVLQARKALGIGSEGDRVSPGVAANGSNTSEFAPPPGPPPSSTKPTPPVGASGPSRSQYEVSPESEKAEDPFRDPVAHASQTQPAPVRQPTAEIPEQRLAAEPYHPGFNPTQSYMGRQDSAVGKVTMHAAVSETPEVERERRGTPTEPAELEEDTYGVSPARNAPIYRY